MSRRMISEHIGFDGEHYYCLHCGRSGYDRMAQARGHLGQCPEKVPKPNLGKLVGWVQERKDAVENLRKCNEQWKEKLQRDIRLWHESIQQEIAVIQRLAQKGGG